MIRSIILPKDAILCENSDESMEIQIIREDGLSLGFVTISWDHRAYR